MITCARLAVAISAGSLMDPGVVDGIVNAAGTADAPVSDAADRLKNAYTQAVAAKNKANEPDAIAAVSAAASDMSGVCADSGLRTTG
jgi:acetyl-CoA carboxylase alpha subunit